ncbi:MAG: hypothetical protein H6964_13820 [Chromatiaceae bacterium]|nr:hypothetical protein [Gammaproteobacteria bacterium]MCB1880538.1 hypothetical protein [Gammaproteobacteria bacterium]MCP5448054.1 hypothetical protein [Chromatiaceae bacterium]
MNRRIYFAIAAVFIGWSVMDFLIHGVLLKPTYAATAALWRPEAEMKMALMSVVTLISSSCFVLIYAFWIESKSTFRAVQYSLIFGLATGISMGFGSYSYMPIPASLAWSWFAASLAEALVAGLLTGIIVRTAESDS